MTQAARQTYRASFDVKHECKLCGTVEIDQSLPAKEKRRQADAARRLHMTRLSHRRGVMSRRAVAASAEAAECAGELAQLDDAV